jgi:hypothetical protein
MFFATIVLLHQCREEHGGAHARQRSLGVLNAFPTSKIVENGFAHMLDHAVNLSVLGR